MASDRLNKLAFWHHPLAWLWLLLVPLLLYLPGLAGFPYPDLETSFSDLAITHYPYGLYIQRSIAEGRLPLWYPGILSGTPLFANPLAGLWYVPGWLGLLLPLPLGFNVLVLAHLLLGGVGMYCLLRAEELAQPAALWGALAFEALPKLAAHYGAGHLTLLYAVPWTPWLLYLAKRSIPAEGRPALRFAGGLSALVLALIFLADPRWCAFAGVLWLAYTLYHQPTPAGLARIAGRVGLAALLAAPLAVPLLQLVASTTRKNLQLQDTFTFSLPPARLLGLLFPDFGGFHEYMLYPGQAVLLLALLGLAGGLLRRQDWFWVLAGAAALVWSLGEAIPPLEFLARLPGFNLLRVPSRALFILDLALVILSACTVNCLVQAQPVRKAGRLLIVGVTAFSLVLAVGVTLVNAKVPPQFAWGAGLALASLVWINLYLAGRIPQPGGPTAWQHQSTTWQRQPAAWQRQPAAWLAGLVVIGLIDWLGVGRTLFVQRPLQPVLGEAAPLVKYLASQEGPFRVYSPSYSLPQQSAAFYGLQLADGVEPMQLTSYVQYMNSVTGVPGTGYSVTLPPFASGDPGVDNAAYRPDPAGLGLLNVTYVAAEFDLPVDGLELVQQFGGTRLYANRQARPRAWVQPAASPLGQDYRPVDALSWSPDRISLQAKGPGLLVLSELAYSGWQVQVDGAPAQLEQAGDLLRGVELPPGEHQVLFRFRPAALAVGLGLGLIGVFVLFLVWIITRRRAGRVHT